MNRFLLVIFIIVAMAGVSVAEPICDTHDGTPCCESGCFQDVGVGNGEWDHIDETYENPWDYWGPGTDAQFACVPCDDPVLNPPTNCWFDNYYDVRSYDPSFPRYDLVNNPGGWSIGYACMENGEGDISVIDRVELEFGPTVESMEHKTIISKPSTYMWGGNLLYDYTIRYGSRYFFEGAPVTITVYLTDGSMWEQQQVTPQITQNKPPVTEIKKMSILKSGELKIRFTAPYDLRDNQIRIRVFEDGPNAAMFYEMKINPPYQRNGKPDELEVVLPEEHEGKKLAGKRARIEYRVFENGMSRSVNYFKLPELE